MTISAQTVGNLLGLTAPAAYREILLSLPEVEGACVFSYSAPPRLQQRIEVTAAEQAVIDGALRIRDATRLPFWEAAFTHCMLEGACPPALLEGALFHHGQGTRQDFTRVELESGILQHVSQYGRTNVALGSAVRCKGGEILHLGLMDFHCAIDQQNTPIVHLICRKLMPQGFVILDSGDSYHACGLTLLSPQERIAMLGRALLLSPIVDVAYIAHQLQQDSSSIRISVGGRAKKCPTVVDAWCAPAGSTR